MKTYYAIYYPYGIACHANTGKRYGSYYRFSSREARDKWVEAGGDYRTSPNYREAIPSKDPELRAEIRRDSDPYLDANMTDGDQELVMLEEEAKHWQEIMEEATA